MTKKRRRKGTGRSVVKGGVIYPFDVDRARPVKPGEWFTVGGIEVPGSDFAEGIVPFGAESLRIREPVEGSSPGRKEAEP
ncbi:hypothetical protein ACFLZP_04890 [Patescibacteria group bacterium]